MDSYYKTQKLYKHYLPIVLSFDKLKSVETANGAMSFHMCDGIAFIIMIIKLEVVLNLLLLICTIYMFY